MLHFKPIRIEDKERITSFTFSNNLNNCDLAFANMCSWSFLYDSEYAIRDGFLFIRFYFEEKERKHLAYMYPVGDGDLHQAINYIEKDAEASGHSLLILGITPESKEKIDSLYTFKFTFLKGRNYFDYIYLREDLATLKGKKYQPKRNHINHFKKQYDYMYLPITKEIIPQCKDLEQIWFEANKAEENTEDLFHERTSMNFAMDHFNELGLIGGAIVVEDKIIAFTYGSPVNHKTFGVHVEKADIHYEGIFSIVCQEFAKRIPQQYVYINREEDLGIPGLRKSKLSYHPYQLLEKYSAIMRR